MADGWRVEDFKPDCQIEMTDQMVEAGANALASWYGLDGEPMHFLRRAAEAAYEAMRPLEGAHASVRFSQDDGY